MALRDAQVVLLCEDQMQQNFAYWWLRERGVERRKIFPRPLPAGSGAGEQFVRQKYAEEVASFRSRAARLTLALIVVIDADCDEVERRIRQLEEALRVAGPAPRDAAEAICVLVPRRNVETWIHFMCSPPATAVDEVTDYKPKSAEECKEAARRLARAVTLVREAPDSLRGAQEELTRLQRVLLAPSA